MKRKKRWSFILLMCYMSIILMCVILFITERFSIRNIIISYLNHTCLFQPCPYVTVNHLYMHILFVCYSCVAPMFSFEWNKEVLHLTIGYPLTHAKQSLDRLVQMNAASLFYSPKSGQKINSAQQFCARFILKRSDT